MNAVTTDVDSTLTPASDDWQADLFGVISPPASAHCDEIDICTDPTVLKAIAPAQASLGIAIIQGIRSVITATRSKFFFILFLLLQASSLMLIIPAATSNAAAYSATPSLTIGSSA
eukprot:846837-Pleurochrysis_carterae.AAC.1